MITKLGISLIGPGAIGKTFLNQLHKQRGTLVEKYELDVKTLGIMGSRKMLIKESGINLQCWQEAYNHQSIEANLDQFFDRITKITSVSQHLFVDSTATELVPEHYTKWLSRGCHIVTPNKKFGSGSLERYKLGRALSKHKKSHFFYEATVGAGLPVISTLQSLLDTGDEVELIEGVFSGTLSYIFNQVSKDCSFSQVVKKAKELGFTEPDPRDDLAGMDVARKVVVLARECGMDIEINDLELESLVPKELESVSDPETFLNELHKVRLASLHFPSFLYLFSQFDENKLKLVNEAEANNQILRYVGMVNVKEGKCEVSLRKYPRTHAFASLKGTDNMIIFKTARYKDQPLVIQGPGAGAEVTAMGVFADVLALAKQLEQT
eukprot:g6720.t1